VGPEASLSLIVGQVITGIINADPHEKPGSEEAAAIAMAVSVIITLQVSVGVIVITGKLEKRTHVPRDSTPQGRIGHPFLGTLQIGILGCGPQSRFITGIHYGNRECVLFLIRQPPSPLTHRARPGSHHFHRTTDSYARSLSPHLTQHLLDSTKQAHIPLPTCFSSEHIYGDYEFRVFGSADRHKVDQAKGKREDWQGFEVHT
jgi:hypothetical protein